MPSVCLVLMTFRKGFQIPSRSKEGFAIFTFKHGPSPVRNVSKWTPAGVVGAVTGSRVLGVFVGEVTDHERLGVYS